MEAIINILKNIISSAVAYLLVSIFILFLLLMMFAEEFGFLHIIHNWAIS